MSAKPAPASEPTAAAADLPSEVVRTALSLLLFIHLFAVATGMLSNGTASKLELAVRRVPFLTGYVQLLGLDASYQFHLTYGEPADFDHYVSAELTQANGQKVERTLPALGVWPGQRYRRLERFARAVASPPNEQDPYDLLARRLAQFWIAETDAVGGTIRAPEVDVERLRTEEPLSKPRWADAGEFRDEYYRGGYQAYVLLVDGRVELMRTAGAGETAPAPANDSVSEGTR